MSRPHRGPAGPGGRPPGTPRWPAARFLRHRAGTLLARGGDPPEPPAGLRPGSFVTGPGPLHRVVVAGGREGSGNFGILAPHRAQHSPGQPTAKGTQMSATPLPGLLGAVAPVLENYGYLAVAGLILVENFGVPAPG